MYWRVTISNAWLLSTMGRSNAFATPSRVLSSWVGPKPPVVKMRLHPLETSLLRALPITGISSLTVVFWITWKFRTFNWLMIHWLLVSRTRPSRISLPITRMPIFVVTGPPLYERSYPA